jgi:hypothetical protein
MNLNHVEYRNTILTSTKLDSIFLKNPFLFEYFGLVLSLVLLFGITFFVKGLQKFRNIVGIALIAVPVIYFYVIISAHVRNIPFSDDYNLLETIYNLQHASGFVDKIKILFEQVNQHRFAFERIIMLIMVFFTGTVNIKLQIMLGNLSMLGILYLLFQTFKKEQVSWYYFIPVPYILFNLVYFENAVWGIAALQNTPLLFFAFLTAYLLGRQTHRSWVFAVIAAIITTFISGSGMLTFIIGIVILVFQKRYKLLAQWVAIAVAMILFYFFFDYHFIPSGSGKVWHHPIFNLVSVFGFWGNALYLDVPHPLMPVFYRDMILCVILGMIILAIFLVFLLRMVFGKNLLWTNWLLLGAFMFLMGTGAMFVMSRPATNYLMYGGNIFSRRYMIFGVVLLATAYVALILVLKKHENLRNSVLILSLAGFLTLNFVSYFMSITSIRKLYEELSLDGYYWKNYATFLSIGDNFGDVPFWNHPTRMKNLVGIIEKTGLSHLAESDKLPAANRIISETGKLQKFAPKPDIILSHRVSGNNDHTRFIEFKTKKESGLKPSYFVLASDKYTVLLPAVPSANSFTDFLRTRTYYDDTSEYGLYKIKLPKGKFDIWLMSENKEKEGTWESRFTREKIFLY